MTTQPIKRVLVATDLSPGADEALRQAHERASAVRAELAVCHVVPSLLRSYPLFPQRGLLATLTAPDLRAWLVETLTARVAELTGRDPQGFTLIIEEGTPHAEVLRWADGWNADLLVVGSQGLTGLARMMLGSVADKLVRHASIPVLVARPHARTGRVLAGTDLSDPSFPAVQAAADHARRTGAALTLLYSIESSPSMTAYALTGSGLALAATLPPELQAELRKVADDSLAEALRQCEAEGDRRVAEGPAAAALLRAAEELDADLVVVGTEGRTGLRRVLIGSVAEMVARAAPCSVLVVRLGRPGQPGRELTS